MTVAAVAMGVVTPSLANPIWSVDSVRDFRAGVLESKDLFVMMRARLT